MTDTDTTTPVTAQELQGALARLLAATANPDALESARDRAATLLARPTLPHFTTENDMDTTYRTYRNAAINAASIGNNSAATHFSRKAAECDWVSPADWHPRTCFAHGIPLPGPDMGNTATFPTKKSAQSAARAIGWPVGDVTKVYGRIYGERWALVDGRFGLVSSFRYQKMHAD